MKFSDVIGQDETKQRLLQMVAEDRVPHAMMLCGPSGCGKMALALAFASYLLCSDRRDGDSCGTCRQCIMTGKYSHPDLHFSYPVIRPTGTGSEHKMSSEDFSSEWRNLLSAGPYFDIDRWLDEMGAANQQAQMGVGESDLLIRQLSLKSSQGGYKVVIIWLPERMNAECANKLLKLLEEPPAQTVFILVSDNPEQILPTILSRTQRIQIPRLTDEDIIAELTGRFGIQKEDAADIARASNGNYILAMQTIHLNEEKRLFLELFISLMRLAYMRNIKDLKKWSENIAAMGREQQKRFLEYCQHMIRENFIFNFHRGELNYMNREERNFSVRFAPFINERNVIKLMNELAEAQVHIEQNVNANMVFFDLTLKTIMLLKQ